MLVPEPKGDIQAQLRAVLDPEHPKRACFVVPQDYAGAGHFCIDKGFMEERHEGRLFTCHKAQALAFRQAPRYPEAAFDAAMAEILGYPEAKPDVMMRCGGGLFGGAQVVQARDGDAWVIHEALTSPAMLECTTQELQRHVPPEGVLMVLTPVKALERRLLLREAGK